MIVKSRKYFCSVAHDLPSGACNHLPDQTLMSLYFPYHFTLCCLSGCHSDIWSSYKWQCTLSRTPSGSLQPMTSFTAPFLGESMSTPVHMTISFETWRQIHLCKMNHILMQTIALCFMESAGCKWCQNSKRKLVWADLFPFWRANNLNWLISG